MLIGYARVSTKDQDLSLQLDALTAAKCERIFSDHGVSGAVLTKPGLEQALDFARAGDTLVVWRLDRLSRNFFDLQQRVEALATAKLGFISLKENIDTTTPYGRLFFHIMGALAEFERHATHERTIAGMAAARAKGKRIGRPPSIDAEAWAAIKDLLAAGAAVPALAKVRGVTRQAIYNRLALEISPQTYQLFKAELAAGADREAMIERMGLFRPALKYREDRERRIAASAAA